jgi:hypothetical protein
MANSTGTLGDAVLPDGLVVVVKRECATCRLVVPVLEALESDAGISIYTQDDAAFPESLSAIDDTDLAVSWALDVETVPTLVRVEAGREMERTVGWVRDEWRRITGNNELGADLPEFRPGCGSLTVDPDLVDELRVRFGGSVLRSRRIDLASQEDEFEALFGRGWTDGLPVVPPTEARVMRMLDGTARAPDDIVATVPPDLVPLTVEKVAIAAVMAGCLPEYMPWVLTAIEAVCNDEFNMHGVLATTMPVGPVLVCSGPGTVAIGMNSEGNALGQGNRANLTIGRALQLVIRNVGGGKPGGVDRATQGNPGKLSFCFAERADTPFSTLAQQRGLPAGVDAVTVFAGEGPRGVVDQLSREPESLAATLASCLRTVQHPKLVIAFDAIVVLSPEHGRVFVDAGWDTTRVIDELRARLQIPGIEFIRGAGGIAEGMPEGLVEHTLNKFRPGGLMLAYAGSGAGLFSSIIAGWAAGAMGSEPVTREVVR